MISRVLAITTAVISFSLLPGIAYTQQNLLPDPSIEETRTPNQFGIPYGKWSGWNFEGGGVFLNGKIAHEGKTCAEIKGSPGCKLRLYSPAVTVPAGRYRFTCYIRGLDIGVHAWGMSEDVNFGGDKYFQLKKSGTFGWTRLEMVSEAPAGELVFRLGLMAEGRLWVDDASLTRVPESIPTTNGPVIGNEERPVTPPAALAADAVHCPECGYRNQPEWRTCYACGDPLQAARASAVGPASKPLVTLAANSAAPFVGSGDGAVGVATEHAPAGGTALRINSGYAVWDGLQAWSGFDLLRMEVFSDNEQPVQLYVEIQDTGTTDYWTRVNYNTVIPPGKSELVVPTTLYVGEKSRPGRALDVAHIKKFVLNPGDTKHPIYFSNMRLERDLSDRIHVKGLQAYSFGPGSAMPFSGFVSVTPSMLYNPGRGFGLKSTGFLRAYDVLQPDPLYQKGILLQQGSFTVDLPDGRYHVMLNIDYPSGFWGEFQIFHHRAIKANGTLVSSDELNRDTFRDKYYRFSQSEDSPLENTFDKYQAAYFREKEFDVEVKGGKLEIALEGDDPFSNALSCLVLYPASQADEGKAYLKNLRERRRFYFDNYFKRIIPDGKRDRSGPIPDYVATAAEKARGFAVFYRDWMNEIPVTAVPRREESSESTGLSLFASAGQLEPVVFSLYPLRNVGEVSARVTDLRAADGHMLPASSFSAGVVSHRLTRVTGEGSVYTISPRYILPTDKADIRSGVTTTFWYTLHAPRAATAGVYSGNIEIKDGAGHRLALLPLKVRLFATPLDELDVAAGPWGSSLGLPWYSNEMGDYARQMFKKSLAKMREYGCTTFSGIPTLRISEWKDKIPKIDFTQADQEMADAKAVGFHNVVVNYNGGIAGFDNYTVDENAMRSAGFSDYTQFLSVVLKVVDEHARATGWLPFAFNLCDEPLGDAAKVSAANARAWDAAAPKGMITTGATSVTGNKPGDPHMELAKSLRIPSLNDHDDASIDAVKGAGRGWAFYNGGSRWTFGTYMFKCAQQYGMKFRLSWHWNAAAGDPYYALDCREDDYCWCNSDAKGNLIPSVEFDREIRAGIDDYRYMLTLQRLVRQNPTKTAAGDAKKLLDDKLASFKLGERDHDAKWAVDEYCKYQLKLAEAIERLSK